MSMEDKILDDDDIIDLTDLLEEGESSKKGAPAKNQGLKPRGPLNEPDSFDLGKEISMEYDVSVEEIDHGGDSLDISGDLSSGEAVALSEDKVLKEEAILDEKEVKELDFSADTLGEEPPAPVEEAPPVKEESPSFAEGDLVRGPVSDFGAKKEPDPEALKAVAGEVESLSFEDVAASAPEPAKAAPVEEAAAPALEPTPDVPVQEMPAGKPEGGMEIEFDRRSLDEGASASKMSSEDIAAEVRQQAPAIIEAIVKPLMADLVKDMIAATREQLPGIVEKVIREEIEKLKKLES